MNIAFFLKPKSEITFLYSDAPLAEALGIMRDNGYSSVPVIDREGRYVSTASEGDFLYALAQTDGSHLRLAPERAAESKCVRDLLRRDRNPSCHIDMPVESLLLRTTEQNFVPVVDDRDIFIGIVTRRNVLNYFLNERSGNGSAPLSGV